MYSYDFISFFPFQFTGAMIPTESENYVDNRTFIFLGTKIKGHGTGSRESVIADRLFRTIWVLREKNEIDFQFGTIISNNINPLRSCCYLTENEACTFLLVRFPYAPRDP